MQQTGWFTPIDAYCERLEPDFWAEPINALTNVAFLLAAYGAFRQWRRFGRGDGLGVVLIVLMAAIGIGSFLFHTVANRWSALADVLPIAAFILAYVFAAMRRFFGLGIVAALAFAGAFLAFDLGFKRLWTVLFGPNADVNGSVGYFPAAVTLATVAVIVSLRDGHLGRRLTLATGVFCLSLVFRSLDEALCTVVPIGTHALWHILNGALLYLLVRTYIDAGRRPQITSDTTR
jgi:hypothetical protein